MYAILDIETTGGKFNEEGITEIAIYRYDGEKIVDRFSSLVNPEKEIQPFVQRLTGINNKMLVNAPKFFELAKRIIEITTDCIVVAHNADFDYRMLRTEFQRLGYTYERKSLCTVNLSQQLLPEAPSYKLGKLVRSLGIPITDAHRAQGDAMATVELFKLLMAKDSNKEILTTQVKELHKEQASPTHLKLVEGLPTEVGVYYLYDKKGEIIYIGKSKNIRKRVLQHLTSEKGKAKKIQQKISEAKFERTGNECIALLKEQHEIKKNKPQFNHALKYRHFAMGIRLNQNTPYHSLIVEQVRNEQDYLEVFKNKKAALEKLRIWRDEFQLCLQQSSQKQGQGSCFEYKVEKCLGACVGEETLSSYNKRLFQIRTLLDYPHRSFLMIDQGKSEGEKSFVYIKDGVFQGYGFFSLNHQIRNLEAIEKRLIPMENNPDTEAVIRSFLQKKRYKKLITLAETYG